MATTIRAGEGNSQLGIANTTVAVCQTTSKTATVMKAGVECRKDAISLPDTPTFIATYFGRKSFVNVSSAATGVLSV